MPHEPELDWLCRVNRQHRANLAGKMAPLDPESPDKLERELAREYPKLAGYWAIDYCRNHEGHWITDEDGDRIKQKVFKSGEVLALLHEPGWKEYVREVISGGTLEQATFGADALKDQRF